MPNSRPGRGILLVVLALFASAFAVLPFFVRSGPVGHGVRMSIEAVLIVASWQFSRNRALIAFVVAVALLNELSTRLMHVYPGTNLVFASLTLDHVFIGTVAAIIGLEAWRSHRVGPEVLLAAIAVYFLLGYFWATGFALLEYAEPGSFSNLCPERVADDPCIAELGRYPRLVYFSFVTMTTLGYGDIAPLSRRAEGLAILAAVTGQLFIAILIGRLVSDYLTQRREDPGER